MVPSSSHAIGAIVAPIRRRTARTSSIHPRQVIWSPTGRHTIDRECYVRHPMMSLQRTELRPSCTRPFSFYRPKQTGAVKSDVAVHRARE